ncbi:MAG: tRNA (adenosine(37)-N6)-threonylcarbamoyltransferase complex ATPase subunit type 1 TsaE [Pseudomonadota bacterium]
MDNYETENNLPGIWTTSFTLNDEAAMKQFGAELGLSLVPGDVVALSGPLGAGKSTLARATIASFAGVSDAPSPTFGLAHAYSRDPLIAPRTATSSETLYHFDLYRLDHPNDVWELGLEVALDGGISLIEWPEKIAHFLPRNSLLARINPVEEIGAKESASGGPRTIILRSGVSWAERLPRNK